MIKKLILGIVALNVAVLPVDHDAPELILAILSAPLIIGFAWQMFLGRNHVHMKEIKIIFKEKKPQVKFCTVCQSNPATKDEFCDDCLPRSTN